MICEYLKFEYEAGAVIWLDLEQPFDENTFLALLSSIPNLVILGRKVVFQSLAPAQIIEEFETSQGSFSIKKQFEDLESGIDIYSDSAPLMRSIVEQLETSSFYRLRNT